jgi:hypothetical protein
VLAAPVEVSVRGAGFTAARDGMSLGAGDQVRTNGGGVALLTFFDGSETQLTPESQVQIQQANSSNSAQIGLTQVLGTTVEHVGELRVYQLLGPVDGGEGMQNNNVSIFLDTPEPSQQTPLGTGLEITFTSSNGDQVGAPAPVLIAAGRTSATVSVAGSLLTTPGSPVTITASATYNNGVVWKSATLQVNVVQPVLPLFDANFNPVQTSRTVGRPVANLLAQLCVTSNDCSDVLTNQQTVLFSISGDTTGGETVTPTSAPIPAGDFATNQIQPPIAITLSSPKGTGSYTLNGFATDPPPVNVTVH